MKIMHIISSAASGGAEVYVRDLAIEMTKQGHDVFLLFLDRAEETGRSRAFETEFLGLLKANGIAFGFIGQAARNNPIRGALAVRKAFKIWQPDIIHTHLYYAAIFCLFLPHCKIVHTHHNIRVGAPQWIYQLLDIRIISYIGICQACTDLLVKLTRRKVVRIDNGVSENRIKVKDSYENRSPVKLIFVGTLSAQKNINLLLNSLTKISDLDFHLSIAGEGGKRKELELLAMDLGVSHRITFLGNVSNIKELLYASDVFVMTSDWEGLPIAQIEATMTGLPVIVTNVGGCAEIVDEVKNGIVVDNNVNNYASALRHLIQDYEYRNKLHLNAIKKSSRYSIMSSVNAHLNLYQSLLLYEEPSKNYSK
jgi:glycosyltransferase involved in cell wall biosynthesis